MTEKKPKAKPLKRRHAPPDHEIYQLGYVLGRNARNELPQTIPEDLPPKNPPYQVDQP